MNLIVRKSLINCIPYIFSAALFPQNSHCIMWSSLSGFSSASWRGFSRGSSKVCELDFVLTGFHFHCFSTHHLRTRPLPKKDSQPSMAEESNAFYVVRKGDIIGIYKSLSDCQAQVCLSVCDPPVSVFKGYGLRKETEEYLASRGLKNPLYSVNASDVKADLFGPLLPCPFQQPDGLVDILPTKTPSLKRTKDMQPDGLVDILPTKPPSPKRTKDKQPDGLDILPTKPPSPKRTKDKQPDGLDILPTKPPSPKRTKDKVQLKLNQIDLSHASALDAAWAKCAPKRGPIKFVCWNNLEGTAGSGSMSTEQSTKHLKQAYSLEAKKVPHSDMSCIIEFDGASKGNPGKAGAGAILRNLDGSVICRLREGLGVATNNVAEYQALLLGMRFALKKGYKQIQVQGDSKIVCMQVEDRWKAKHENMACLCKEAKGLKDSFLSFSINHVKREFNADADAEANLAVDLPVGDITEEFS
ncbi:Caulimovirus viroplasmin [Musa troglodytarum]|uniref:Caulimovirus viroplasmin n=1 Tax=Musa troglodytarum TaxID=320322 RepID=A0A9E7H5I3_9LILI|nr:Caulimovirus viroplasmin [Musa troglodytarum]